MISLLIAGGVSVAANVQATNWPIIDNHTLKGEEIPSNQVVCRNMWGTPMLPDGKGGYSLIAPINPSHRRCPRLQLPRHLLPLRWKKLPRWNLPLPSKPHRLTLSARLPAPTRRGEN